MANDGMKRVFQTELTKSYPTDLETLGTIRWEGDKCYKWLRIVHAAYSGGAGWCAKYAYDSGYDDNMVTYAQHSESQHGAGVSLSLIHI